MKRFFAIFTTILLTLPLFSEARNALLIANNNYQSSRFDTLGSPIREARDLKKSLEQLGFTVTVVENGSRKNMRDSIIAFGQKLEKQGGIGFFHYGGHAVQVDGKNYLIPVDADLPDEKSVPYYAIIADEVMDRMEADANIIILDCCRDNPFKKFRTIGKTGGLAETKVKPRNSIVVYSAAIDQEAQDGVFTPILAKKILEKKSFTSILADVRLEVSKQTEGNQYPRDDSGLIEEIYLAGYISATDAKTSEEYFVLGDLAHYNGNYKQAVAYFQKAADMGNSDAQFALGTCYLYGQGVPQDNKKGIAYIEKAAYQGNPWAQVNIGSLYLTGDIGFSKDYKQAFEWFNKAAKQGAPDAYYHLGAMYFTGEMGVPQNYTKSREYFLKAMNAEKGLHPEARKYAQYALGHLYAEGLGGSKDINTAISYFQKAAEQGYEPAKESLEFLAFSSDYDLALEAYNKGDYETAKKYFQKLADMGDADAQMSLGGLYAMGKGVPQDYKQALKWYKKSAEQGNANAQAALGYFYEESLGVEKNLETAMNYYKKSAAQGNEGARESIEYLNKWMFPLFGLELGKSSEADVKRKGRKAKDGYEINGVVFDCEESGKLVAVFISSENGVWPQELVRNGYDSNFTYTQWKEFIMSQGYDIIKDTVTKLYVSKFFPIPHLIIAHFKNNRINSLAISDMGEMTFETYQKFYEKVNNTISEQFVPKNIISSPQLTVLMSPEYFSPDGDGENDLLDIELKCIDESPIANWSFEIKDPNNNPFWSTSGKVLIKYIVWSGRSSNGELVQSAMYYPYTFTVTNEYGVKSTVDGKIETDILVLRDGDGLKISVPAIIFRQDAADFYVRQVDSSGKITKSGITEAQAENNERILKQVAKILNKYKKYRITVEVHMNSVTGLEDEETTNKYGFALEPLSEDRARFIVQKLKKYGVKGDRLSAVGRGGRRPVVARGDKANDWKNRRIEFILEK